MIDARYESVTRTSVELLICFVSLLLVLSRRLYDIHDCMRVLLNIWK